MKIAPILLVVVSIVTPAVHSQASYGAGTAGAGGVTPSFSCGQPWMGNAAFSLDVSNGLGGATAWVGVSFAPATVFFNGANLLIDVTPSQLFLVQALSLSGPSGAAGAGSASLSYPLAIPPTPALAGLTLYAQVGVDEGGGTWAASRGIAITLTMPPRIVVGSSVGGSADPFCVVDPTDGPPTISAGFNVPGGIAGTINNCTDAAFAHNGRRAYVGQSIGNAIQELNLETSPPTWSQFYAAPGATYGIGVDHLADRTYTLGGNSATTFELVAIDSALGSPTYGQTLASTTGLSGFGFIERWEISPDGARAAVLTVFSRRLLIVDTSPSSTNYMDWTDVGIVPVNQAIFAISTRCAFTPDGLQVLVTIQTGGGGVGEIARYDVLLAQWLDHNPAQIGVQNIGTQSNPPALVPSAPGDVEVSNDGTFAIVVGWGGPGGIARIDLDPSNPLAWGFGLIPSPVSLSGAAHACAISGDDTRFVTYGSGQLLVFDALVGTLVSQVPLPGMSSANTITWE